MESRANLDASCLTRLSRAGHGPHDRNPLHRCLREPQLHFNPALSNPGLSAGWIGAYGLDLVAASLASRLQRVREPSPRRTATSRRCPFALKKRKPAQQRCVGDKTAAPRYPAAWSRVGPVVLLFIVAASEIVVSGGGRSIPPTWRASEIADSTRIRESGSSPERCVSTMFEIRPLGEIRATAVDCQSGANPASGTLTNFHRRSLCTHKGVSQAAGMKHPARALSATGEDPPAVGLAGRWSSRQE